MFLPQLSTGGVSIHDVRYLREMAQEPDRNMTCSKCGVVTVHRVFSTRDGNGKVTRSCTCKECGTSNKPCGAQ